MIRDDETLYVWKFALRRTSVPAARLSDSRPERGRAGEWQGRALTLSPQGN